MALCTNKSDNSIYAQMGNNAKLYMQNNCNTNYTFIGLKGQCSHQEYHQGKFRRRFKFHQGKCENKEGKRQWGGGDLLHWLWCRPVQTWIQGKTKCQVSV